MLAYSKSDTEKYEHYVWVKKVSKIQQALQTMERQLGENCIKMSSGSKKLVSFLQQKYKDVIKFDATK